MRAVLSTLWRRLGRRAVVDNDIEQLIAENRARTVPGMERMDEALRDRAARRRRERDEVLENVRRELDNPRQLRRVSR